MRGQGEAWNLREQHDARHAVGRKKRHPLSSGEIGWQVQDVAAKSAGSHDNVDQILLCEEGYFHPIEQRVDDNPLVEARHVTENVAMLPSRLCGASPPSLAVHRVAKDNVPVSDPSDHQDRTLDGRCPKLKRRAKIEGRRITPGLD